MKIKSSNQSRKKLLYALAASIIVLGALLVYVYMNNNRDDNSQVNYDNATQEQREAGEKVKEDVISRDTDVKTNPGTGGGTSSTSPSNELPISITSTNQTNDTLQIRTRVDVVTNDGTCTLTLQQGSRVIEESAQVQPLPNTSTCKGFDIPLSKLGSGTWSITVVFKSTSGTGTATKEVNITI